MLPWSLNHFNQEQNAQRATLKFKKTKPCIPGIFITPIPSLKEGIIAISAAASRQLFSGWHNKSIRITVTQQRTNYSNKSHSIRCKYFCKCLSQYICCQSSLSSCFASNCFANQLIEWIWAPQSPQRTSYSFFHAPSKFNHLPGNAYAVRLANFYLFLIIFIALFWTSL